MLLVAALILGGCINNNPITPPKMIQINNIGWIYTNNPSDFDGGRLEINLDLQYVGSSLVPSDIAFYKVTAAGTTWTIPVTDTNLIDATGDIQQTLSTTSYAANASVLPIGTYAFELKLVNGSDLSRSVSFPAPGSSATNGFAFVYTEDYVGAPPATYARMIRRPVVHSFTNVADTITIAFTENDSLFNNGYVWFFNSSGSFIGNTTYFRDVNAKTVAGIINTGYTLYTDTTAQNVLKLGQQDCYMYAPFTITDIAAVRVVVTDGTQYMSIPDYSYDCRAVSFLAHL